MPTAGSQDSTAVFVLTAEPRTPVGLTHRLKLLLGPSGWIATAYHDPYLAMAELCLRERAQASRAAWGLQLDDAASAWLAWMTKLDTRSLPRSAMPATQPLPMGAALQRAPRRPRG